VNNRRGTPGITVVSVVAIVLVMLISGILETWEQQVVGMNSFAAEHNVPFQLIAVLLGLTICGALLWRLTKVALLTRVETLCVTFALLIGIPLMTQGFWHRIFSASATIGQDPAMLQYYDQYPEKLWPHGRNLLDGALRKEYSPPEGVSRAVDGVVWEEMEVEEGRSETVAVLVNDDPNDVSSVRITLPIDTDPGVDGLVPRERYMAVVLARPGEAPRFALPAGSQYYCRVYTDQEETFSQIFTSSAPGRRTVMHPSGFVRRGSNSVAIPPLAAETITVEFGLSGRGRVALRDARFFSNESIESALRGLEIVTRSQYEELPLSERGNLVVRPDNLLSWSGIKFIFSAYIPVHQWAGPILLWTLIILLVLAGSLAMNVILRRQWMENERYLLPLTRIPMALIGGSGQLEVEQPAEHMGFVPIWKSKAMWLGLVLAFIYTLLRGYSYYNPKFPDLTIFVKLKPYFQDPAYGATFNDANFGVSLVLVSIAMFMELGILLSLVLGFWLYRFHFQVGEWTGWSVHTDYPFKNQQQTGAYLMYALVIIIFTRKYLWSVLKAAFTGDKQAWKDEIMSYPVALVLLAASFVGTMIWSAYVGVPLGGMALLFLSLMAVALIATKIRTECGVPFSYLGLHNAAIALALLGGTAVFGPAMMIFAVVISFLVGGTPFFLLPGIQMEIMEIGRRTGLVKRHVLYTIILGVLGGMLAGGWAFLSYSYSQRGAMESPYWWAYRSKSTYFFGDFRTDVTEANQKLLEDGDGGEDAGDEQAGGGISPRTWGYIYGAGATAVVAVARQFFSWFWFHPVGVLLAPTYLMQLAWGSALVAWMIRRGALAIGGAAAVRSYIRPFFIGVFVGAVVAHFIHTGISSYLMTQGVEEVFRWNTIQLIP
jgi:hypothetical protein